MTKRGTLYLVGITTAILVIAVVASFSHGHGRSKTTSANASSVNTSSVSIQDYMFSPMAITIKVGTTVTWTNHDQVHHSVTADQVSKNVLNGPLIGQNQSYSFTFTKVGTYSFHCLPHPYMHGTVVVTN